MNELKSIVVAAERLRRANEPFLVATVVRVSGSSYRRPGARMLLTRDRWIAGSVSGGCLEQDLVKTAWWTTRAGKPALVTYDAQSADDIGWGLGLGCDGRVDILVERERRDAIDGIAFVARCFERQERGALATVFAGDSSHVGARVALGADGVVESDDVESRTRDWITDACRETLATGVTTVTAGPSRTRTIDVLVEAVLPPARLFVFGAGHDAIPVVAIAATVGWETVVCEPHARFATRERFRHADAILVGDPSELAAQVDASDRPMAVVMSHDYERDRACLGALLATRVPYLGVLGPRRRTARMLRELGLGDAEPRVHAPVGLDLGAETPHEIALAIVAEAQSVLTRTEAASLREREGPIHACPTRARAAE